MSTTEHLDTFDSSFVRGPLRLSQDKRVLSYTFAEATLNDAPPATIGGGGGDKVATTVAVIPPLRWTTVPLSVDGSYAIAADGKIHEWAIKINSDGYMPQNSSRSAASSNNSELFLQEDDGDDMIIGVLPCALWSAAATSSDTDAAKNNTATARAQQQLRQHFNNGFHVAQPHVNLTKIFDRYFDVADMMVALPKRQLMAAIATFAWHNDKIMERWQEWERTTPSQQELLQLAMKGSVSNNNNNGNKNHNDIDGRDGVGQLLTVGMVSTESWSAQNNSCFAPDAAAKAATALLHPGATAGGGRPAFPASSGVIGSGFAGDVSPPRLHSADDKQQKQGGAGEGVDAGQIVKSPLFAYILDLKYRLHELATTYLNKMPLARIFFAAFPQGDAPLRQFLHRYISRLDASPASRVSRAVSRYCPEQLRNSAAIESWIRSVARDVAANPADRRSPTLDEMIKTSTETTGSRESGNSSSNYEYQEPVHATPDLDTLIDLLLSETSPVEFGVGLCRDGTTRGAAQLVSPAAKRASFKAGDTVFLTLDSRSARLCIRIGSGSSALASSSNKNTGDAIQSERLVVADIEVDMNPSDSPHRVSGVVFAPAVSLCRPGQSVEITYHEVIPRSAQKRIPWEREGAISLDAARPASAYMRSAVDYDPSSNNSNNNGDGNKNRGGSSSQKRRSAIAQGEPRWCVPPLSTESCSCSTSSELAELFRGVPRGQLSNKILQENACCVTAKNVLDVILDPRNAIASSLSSFSFVSPVSPHGVPVLTESAARDLVDRINTTCKARGNNASTFFDVYFPPNRRSINASVAIAEAFSAAAGTASSSSSNVFHAPPIEHSACLWRRISQFAADERKVDERSHTPIRASRRLPLLNYPQLVAPSADPRDVVRGANFDELHFGTTVAEIASLAMVPDFVESRFYPSTYNPAGIYAVSLFCPYTQRNFAVIIDDFIPCNEPESSAEQPQPRFLRSSRRNEYWVPLVLKALAKLAGSYQGLWDGAVSPAASPGVLLRGGGTVRTYRPSASNPVELFHVLRDYADAGDVTFAVCGSRDPITGCDTVVALQDGTYAGSSYLVLRVVPVRDGESTKEFNMIELLSASTKEMWIGSWSPDSTKWRQHRPVAIACDGEGSIQASKGAALPEELAALRRTCSFWVSAEEFSIYFTLKCISTGRHSSHVIAQEEQRTQQQQQQQQRVADDGSDASSASSSSLLLRVQENLSAARALLRPRPVASLTLFERQEQQQLQQKQQQQQLNVQHVKMQYISHRAVEDINERDLILGVSGALFEATSPQFLLDLSGAASHSVSVSLLCDVAIGRIGGGASSRGIVRKADTSKDVPSPCVAIFRCPDAASERSVSSSRSRRILFPEPTAPSRIVKNTLSPDAILRDPVVLGNPQQEHPVATMRWTSGGWTEIQSLQKHTSPVAFSSAASESNSNGGANLILSGAGKYIIVVGMARSAGASPLELSLISSEKLPQLQMLPPIPYRSIGGTIVCFGASRHGGAGGGGNSPMNSRPGSRRSPTRARSPTRIRGTVESSSCGEKIGAIAAASSAPATTSTFAVVVTSSGSGDDRVIIDADIATSALPCNARLQVTVRETGPDSFKQIVVRGEEAWTTRVSCAVPLPSEGKRFVFVQLVCTDTADGNGVLLPLSGEGSVLPAEVRVTSVLGKRHKVSVLDG